MLKKQTLSKAQLRKLGTIKKDKNLNANIKEFIISTGTNLSHKQVHSKWYYVNVLSKKSKSAPVVRKSSSSKIKPYILEKGVMVTARGDQRLREEVMKKMKPNLLAMGVRVHTLPIYRADQKAFRDLVKGKDFEGRVYGLTKIPDNPKMLRVYRKI